MRVRTTYEPDYATAERKMRAAIANAVPDYSESQVRERAQAQLAKFIRSGKLVIGSTITGGR